MAQTINTDAPAYIVDGTLTDGEAWVALQTVVVEGTSTATITFQSSTGANDWSQYQDLVLISYAASEAVGGSSAGYVNFNNDTGSNYPYQWFWGSGSANSTSGSTTNKLYCDSTSGTASPQPWGIGILYIHDVNSGKYKSTVAQVAGERIGDASSVVGIYTAMWKNQGAITEIDVACGFDYLPDSRFDLFGVLPRMVS